MLGLQNTFKHKLVSHKTPNSHIALREMILSLGHTSAIVHLRQAATGIFFKSQRVASNTQKVAEGSNQVP